MRPLCHDLTLRPARTSRVIQLQVHLPGVRTTESANLEVDDNQATEPTTKEQQINPEPGVVNAEPLLSSEELQSHRLVPAENR